MSSTHGARPASCPASCPLWADAACVGFPASMVLPAHETCYSAGGRPADPVCRAVAPLSILRHPATNRQESRSAERRPAGCRPAGCRPAGCRPAGCRPAGCPPNCPHQEAVTRSAYLSSPSGSRLFCQSRNSTSSGEVVPRPFNCINSRSPSVK